MKTYLKWLHPYKNYFLYGGIFLYLSSLALPSLRDSSDVQYGIEVLLVGSFAVFSLMFSWFSNIFFFTCLFCAKHKNYKQGLRYAVLAFIIGLQTLLMPLFDNFNHWSVSVGYFVWESSFVFLVMYFYLASTFSQKEIVDKEVVILGSDEEANKFAGISIFSVIIFIFIVSICIFDFLFFEFTGKHFFI